MLLAVYMHKTNNSHNDEIFDDVTQDSDDEADYSFLVDEAEDEESEGLDSLLDYIAEQTAKGTVLVSSNLQVIRHSNNFSGDKLKFRNELNTWFAEVQEKIVQHLEIKGREYLPATGDGPSTESIFGQRIADWISNIFLGLPSNFTDITRTLEEIGDCYKTDLDAIYNIKQQHAAWHTKNLQKKREYLPVLNDIVNDFFWEAGRCDYWIEKILNFFANKDSAKHVEWLVGVKSLTEQMHAEFVKYPEHFKNHINAHVNNIFNILNFLRIKALELKQPSSSIYNVMHTYKQLLALVNKQLDEIQIDFTQYIKMLNLTGYHHGIDYMQQWLRENVQRQLAKNLFMAQKLPVDIIDLHNLDLSRLSEDKLSNTITYVTMKFALNEFAAQKTSIKEINKAIEQKYATMSNAELVTYVQSQKQKYFDHFDACLAKNKSIMDDEMINLTTACEKLHIMNEFVEIDQLLLGTEATQDWHNWLKLDWSDAGFPPEETEAAYNILSYFLGTTKYYISAFINSYDEAFESMASYADFLYLLERSQEMMPDAIKTYSGYISEDALSLGWPDYLINLSNATIAQVGLMLKEMFKPITVLQE